MDELSIQVHQNLDEYQFKSIQELLSTCANSDGLNPFSEHAILHIQYGNESEVQHFFCHQGHKLVGYAHVDLSDSVSGPNIEVAVLPQFRRLGVGKKLIEEVLSKNGGKTIRLWAHGLNTGAASLAASCGFRQVRTLWQMRRSLNTPIPESGFPKDLTLRKFEIDTDLDAWLLCNQVAFADHPEQGQWNKSNLQHRLIEDWFDPNGLKVLISENSVVGYSWTKVDAANADSKLGEIYVIGVHPDWQNHGIGKALTLDGLRYLRSLNLNSALLYVDAENERAISLYEYLGFSHWDTDTLFQLD